MCSVAHSPKGWTDGVIGHLWIEDFDNKTHAKSNGRTKLLLIDGHNSHYTQEFLEYAMCYLAHATHIYQGLDVVVFGPLKHYWTQERDEYEQKTRQKLDKTNFISIYSKAHQKAFTPETIRAAFRKTGIWPFNPDVVTEDIMAPSLVTSSVGHLPIS